MAYAIAGAAAADQRLRAGQRVPRQNSCSRSTKNIEPLSPGIHPGHPLPSCWGNRTSSHTYGDPTRWTTKVDPCETGREKEKDGHDIRTYTVKRDDEGKKHAVRYRRCDSRGRATARAADTRATRMTLRHGDCLKPPQTRFRYKKGGHDSRTYVRR